MTLVLNLFGLTVLALLVWLAVRGQAAGDRSGTGHGRGLDERETRTREDR
jgi:hypothetical protein